MGVGANIRRIRERQGMQQTDLAQGAGITRSFLCQVERETKNPSLQIAHELAKALHCRMEDFLDENGD